MKNLLMKLKKKMLADTSADHPQYTNTIIKISLKKRKTKKDRRLIDKKSAQLTNKMKENILRKPNFSGKSTFWDNI
jgi:hypothetical protein